ncbi:hypothetical protein CDV36_003031 [Fusarium kuroshium]|uniref:Uncharacterized protein n=1 Tax=Fusarium kuroshium TaxID=2010991 RepID=A0A3M2SIC3_9HYPO|nr:hypothetical protein CDV36_003031 [Fusarium kuroshium]
MALLKRHIVTNHLSKDFIHQCILCSSWFRSHKALQNHLNTKACRTVPPTIMNGCEWGIGDAIVSALSDRGRGSMVGTWEHLWHVVFPDSDPMSPDFVPPPIDYAQTNASTQKGAENFTQSALASESRPLSSSNPQQETSHCQACPTVECEPKMPSANSSLQQVGLARVHIEILSLLDQHRRWKCRDTESCDGFASDLGSEGSEDDTCSSGVHKSDGSAGTSPTGTAPIMGNASDGQASVPQAGQLTLPWRRNRTEEGEDDDEGNGRPGKRRRRQPGDMEPARGRFACPYQAFDASRSCFLPSLRNPNGGCDSISRLKDHMTRKHMLSYRCQRCWKQFNARDKAQAHPESDCVEKQMPGFEWFMTLEQEREVENCSGTHPEDSWWKLFRLLIPEMAQEDISRLKGRYFPYYVRVDLSLVVPSLYLTNVSFQDSHVQPSGHLNGIEATPPAFPSDGFWGLESSSQTSQSLLVPLYGGSIPAPSSIPSAEGSAADVMTLSVAQQSSDSDSTAPSDRINVSTPASQSNMASSSSSSTLDISQMQRNYERQKFRASQAERENGELRATMTASRERVRDAAVLLDGLLVRGNLDIESYEEVSRAAEILLGVDRCLR